MRISALEEGCRRGEPDSSYDSATVGKIIARAVRIKGWTVDPPNTGWYSRTAGRVDAPGETR